MANATPDSERDAVWLTQGRVANATRDNEGNAS